MEFLYTEDRANDLLEYLKNNIKKGHSLEFWRIWRDEKRDINPKIKSFTDISLHDINEIFTNDESHSCIILKG